MVHILALTSSVKTTSRSTQLLERLVLRLQEQYDQCTVVRRDLAKDQLPHFSEELRQAFIAQQDTIFGDQDNLSRKLIAELKEADLILVALPIYNWSIPSTLKCWIDHVVRLGHTFYTTPTGIEGLLSQPGKDGYNHQKEVVFIVSSGLTPAVHVTKYLKAVFNFMGISKSHEIEATYLDQDSVPKEAYDRVEELATHLLNHHAA